MGHDPFETTTKVDVSAKRLEVTLVMARATAVEWLGPAHVPDQGAPWTDPGVAHELYRVTSGGQPLQLASSEVRWGTEGESEGDLVFRLVYSAPARGPLQLEARYLKKLAGGFTGAVQATHGHPPEFLAMKVLHEGDPTFVVELPAPHSPAVDPAAEGGAADAPAGRSSAPRSGPFGTFLKIGMHHVLLGWDHLLFLLGVLLSCTGLRRILGVLTTFTVAHSVTLALAVFHIVPLASSVVEPLIALSIAVAAFWGRQLDARGLLFPMTFAFGLIHGLGFASGLEALSDGGTIRIVSLFAFNLGVEAGQVIAAAVAVPVLRSFEGSSKGNVALRYTSVAVGLAGTGVFAWRLAGT